ncbi:hypothetical protein UFOVP571_25 [uncultured Caudovirales phage]|uniref:Uncharacterized protein n=1 Tax=uncultured Caudovirales phage TaxID=2100421 RepID=A0A6J5MUE9_9CAUD|nr:hypothetical protein UFOVP571_25 [uncultured Caudovirales phage]
MNHKRNIKRELEYLKAQDIATLKNSFDKLKKIRDKSYFASSITITIKDIAGNEIIAETAIIDGFTNETIEQLQLEIKRTQDLIISLNKTNW